MNILEVNMLLLVTAAKRERNKYKKITKITIQYICDNLMNKLQTTIQYHNDYIHLHYN